MSIALAPTAEVPAVGSTAPPFELVNQFGEPVLLQDYRGRTVVLVFYPFAFSGICTGELGDLRDNAAAFEAAGAAVLAVSADSKFSLRAYAEQEDFGFDLLSDFWPHGAVASAYGVFDPASGMARRGTFIIDPGGTIRYSVLNPRGVARDVGAYLAALATLAGS